MTAPPMSPLLAADSRRLQTFQDDELKTGSQDPLGEMAPLRDKLGAGQTTPCQELLRQTDSIGEEVEARKAYQNRRRERALRAASSLAGSPHFSASFEWESTPNQEVRPFSSQRSASMKPERLFSESTLPYDAVDAMRSWGLPSVGAAAELSPKTQATAGEELSLTPTLLVTYPSLAPTLEVTYPNLAPATAVPPFQLVRVFESGPTSLSPNAEAAASARHSELQQERDVDQQGQVMPVAVLAQEGAEVETGASANLRMESDADMARQFLQEADMTEKEIETEEEAEEDDEELLRVDTSAEGAALEAASPASAVANAISHANADESRVIHHSPVSPAGRRSNASNCSQDTQMESCTPDSAFDTCVLQGDDLVTESACASNTCVVLGSNSVVNSTGSLSGRRRRLIGKRRAQHYDSPLKVLRTGTAIIRENIGHVLAPPEQGSMVRVLGDGWGGGSGDYLAIVTEADAQTFTVIRSAGDWEETHVLRQSCVKLKNDEVRKISRSSASGVRRRRSSTASYKRRRKA